LTILFVCRLPSSVKEQRASLSAVNPNSLHDAPHVLLPRLFLNESVLVKAVPDASESNAAVRAPATRAFLISIMVRYLV
jgi:hypothetical protein